MNKTKVCNTCLKRKSVEKFHKQKGTKDGLRHYCGRCNAIKIRNYRKTGKTSLGEFENLSMRRLDSIRSQLETAYKKHGYKLELNSSQQTVGEENAKM